MTLRTLSPIAWRRVHPSRADEGFGQTMDSLHRSLNHFFENGLSTGLNEAYTLMPRLDASEDEKAVYVSVELPGMAQKDIDVTLENQMLTIRGEKVSQSTDVQNSFASERVYGRFSRSIELNADIDEAKIKAEFKDGVLNIVLPKAKEAQARVRHIPIK